MFKWSLGYLNKDSVPQTRKVITQFCQVMAPYSPGDSDKRAHGGGGMGGGGRCWRARDPSPVRKVKGTGNTWKREDSKGHMTTAFKYLKWGRKHMRSFWTRVRKWDISWEGEEADSIHPQSQLLDSGPQRLDEVWAPSTGSNEEEELILQALGMLQRGFLPCGRGRLDHL